MELLREDGAFGFIVQLPVLSSSRMASLRSLLSGSTRALWTIPFDDRPGKLFEGLEHCRASILLARKASVGASCAFATTRYNRWPTEARAALFSNFRFSAVGDPNIFLERFPKIASPCMGSVLLKLLTGPRRKIGAVLRGRPSDHFVFYQEATGYWVKATAGIPFYSKNGYEGAPAHGRYLYFPDRDITHIVCAVLNSSLFYCYFIAYGDCFHLSDTLASGFPLAETLPQDTNLTALNERLMQDLRTHAARKTILTRAGDSISYDEYVVYKSKAIVDEIDHLLAEHYEFTNEELDFIVSYDIKYRLGSDANSEEG